MDFRNSLVPSVPVIRMVSGPIFGSAVRWNVRKDCGREHRSEPGGNEDRT
jgi:hypothetical protein